MIFFGHLGITTGVVKIYEGLSGKKDEKSFIDYRFVLVGSILPDIIDKPIGAVFLRSVFHNSRIFAHSLLFAVILIVLGILRNRKYNKQGILLLGIGSLIHQVLDSMWLFPKIALWPFLGFKFPTRTEGNWVMSDVYRLISDPAYYGPELLGFIIIAYYFIKLVRNRKVKEFIRTGRV